LSFRLAAALLASATVAFSSPPDPLNGHVMITVPAGVYTVGTEGDISNPRRSVHLAAYRIADAETTNAEFARFVQATGYVTDAERAGFGLVSREGMIDWEWEKVPGANWRLPFGPGFPTAADQPNYPVTQISGADAEAYCQWIGGRLPTLDEWEVAARAGSDTRYPWGDTFDPKKANVWNGPDHRKNLLTDGFLYTAPVRSFPPNAWGIYDVIGNVFEYCTGLSAARLAAGADPATTISARGGSWWCSEGTCNSFNLVTIGAMDLHGTLANQGFRLVLPAQK